MARLRKRDIEEIVKRDLPGWTVVTHARDADAPQFSARTDDVSPDITALRRKFLGDAAADSAGGDAPLADASEPDDVMVTVAPKDTSSGLRAKRVLVSGASGRVVGSQG